MQKSSRQAINNFEIVQFLMGHTADLIYFKDRESRFIRINDAACRLFGLKHPREALGKTDFDFYSKEHAQKAFEDEQNIMASGKPLLNIEEKLTWDGRESIWVSASKMPLLDKKGKIIGTFGISRDITALKNIEEKLTLKEQELSSILNNMSDAVWSAQWPGMDFIYLSPSIEKILGRPMEDFLANKNLWFALVAEEDKLRLRESSARLGQKGQNHIQYRIKRPDGQTVWLDDKNWLVYDPQGKPVRVDGIASDITQQKQAEQALRQSQQQLENFFSQSLIGFFFMMLDKPIDWGPDTDKDKTLDYVFGHQRMTKVNQALLDQYRAKKKDFVGLTPQELFGHNLDHGRRIWRGLFDKGRWHVETDERRMDGSRMWVEGDYICLYDRQGRITGHFGVQADVTGKKAAQEKTKKLMEDKEILLENIDAQVWYLEDAYTYAAVNSAHAHFLGKPKKNLEHQKIQDIFSREIAEIFIAGNKQVFETKKSVRTEVWVFNSQGHKRLLSVTKNPKIDVQGKVESVVCSAYDITEQKHSEQQLQQSRDQYQSLVDNIPGITYRCALDKDWTMHYISSVVKSISGYPVDDFMGNKVRSYASIIHREDAAYVRQKIQAAAKAKKSWNIEYRIIHKNGNIRWVLEKGRAVRSKDKKIEFLDGFIMDISNRKHTEQELAYHNRFQKLVTDLSTDFLKANRANIDKKIHNLLQQAGTFFEVDRAYLFQFSGDGKTMTNTHEWCAAAIQPQKDSLQDLPTDSLPWWKEKIFSKDHVYIPRVKKLSPQAAAEKKKFCSQDIVSLLSVPIISDEKVTGFFGFDSVRGPKHWKETQIGYLKILANILADAHRKVASEKKLVAAKRHAEAASRAKSEFLANMSHEIRTPLNAVIGFSELLEARIREPEHKKYLTSISTSGQSLLAIIDDILDLSKIEAGKLALEPETVNLLDIFSEVGQVFSLKVKQKGLAFITDIDPDIPPAVILDQVRLRQVLFNLIGNAVKFTPKGYVKLAAGKRCQQGARKIDLLLSVEDSGMGIPPDMQKEIFRPFVQAKDQGSGCGGTGLGLPITKRLVDMMGGKIGLVSQPGQGARFEITIEGVPLASPAKKKKDSPRSTEGIRFGPAKVLVADDVDSNRLLIEACLAPQGITVLAAKDGRQAYRMAQEHKPCLVLMDIRMPRLDGYGALAKIRAEPALKETRVVAVTASASAQDRKKVLAVGFDGYIRKPVTKDVLLEEVAKHIPGTQARPQKKDRKKVQVPAYPKAVLQDLKNRYAARCRHIKETFILSEVEAFCKDVGACSKRKKIGPLARWAQDTASLAQSYDMEALPRALDDFSRILEEMERRAHER